MATRPINEQVVVITGASSGIGRVTALQFAQKGATVVLAARNEEALNTVANEIRSQNGVALVIVTDVTDRQQVDDLAQATLNRYGRIDTWVNDAGVSEYSLVTDMTNDEIVHIIQTNLLGTIYGSRAAVAAMRDSTEYKGTLINIGSVLSDRAVPLQSVYCATKHGVKGFTEALRVELQHEKLPINVTLIKPTVINTPFYTNARSHMGVRPAPVPPLYAPDVVATAIVSAAQTPRRDIYAGGTAKAMSLMQTLSPSAMDWFMVHTETFFGGQKSDKPDDGTSNLFAPVGGKGQERGYDKPSISFDPYTVLVEQVPRRQKFAIAAVLVGIGAAFWLSRRKG